MHLSSKQQSTFMSMNTPNVSALTTNKPTIVHVISGLGQGGAETVLYRLLSATKSGFHHHVISLGGLDEIGPLLQKEGIEVQALGLTKKTLWTQGNKLFLQALRQINPNVIQTWMYHSNAIAGWWAYRAGYHDRIVWNIRNSGQHLEEFSFISRLSFRFGAWLSRRIPTAIVSCAHSAAKKHRQLGYQGPEITVIPNGVDTEKWHPNQEQGQQQRAQMRILPDMPVIGVVARWHPLKDYPNFLQALGQLIEKYPNVKCLLLGAGLTQTNKVLMGLIERYNLAGNVLLLGERHDVAQWMQAMDIFVLPSKAEGFPNVVCEAMACQLRCVVTDVGDAALIVGQEGIVVPAQQPERLAQGMEQAVFDLGTDAHRQAVSAGRVRIQKEFSLQKMCHNYQQLWQTVASKAKN